MITVVELATQLRPLLPIALAIAGGTGALRYRAESTDLVYPTSEVTSFVVGARPGGRPKSPLLFVHGCAHGGWVFRGLAQELSAHGYESHCLTLPKSKFKTLEQYTADIGGYIAAHVDGGRPVLLGHSQGGVEVQHYLLNENVDVPPDKRAAAGVFLASAAGHSLESSVRILLSLLRSYPLAVLRSIVDSNGAEAVGINDLEMMKSTMFAPGTTVTTVCGEGEETLEAYAERLSPVDSILVAGDALMHHRAGRNKTTPKDLGIPTLTVAAEKDGIIPAFATDSVAEYWGNELVTIPGQGHCFGDAGWESTAVPPLVRWLDANVAAPQK